MKVLIFVCLNACLFLSGCATILSGRSQTLTVQTNPSGARCELTRQGRIVGTVESTPGAVTLDKTKDDISVACKKAGFGDANSYAESGWDGATIGNVLLGGVIGWGIDSAVGADNRYPDVVTVNLPSPSSEPAIPTQPTSGVIAAARTGVSDIEKRLRDLEQLREQNLINDADYKKAKQKILSDI